MLKLLCEYSTRVSKLPRKKPGVLQHARDETHYD